ncbi:hypothetical protein [Streptomyces pseudogriseolus]|uniref:hypothetical protein n=1 Tax=Streptomyces pseudogriseolus TaxID=36817 RepID=UPI003FA2EDB0
MQTTIAVPTVDVPRYDAPRITITPVTEVIPTEPIDPRKRPGAYQHVLLHTRTGQLSFHEGDEHRTPWDPAWRYVNDVPQEIWKRWHPGTSFPPNSGQMLWEPVPELLCFSVDSGHSERPYLDVADANALLTLLAPTAQALLDNLYAVSGDLDWSAASVHAGRNLLRLTSRHQATEGPDADRDVVDYADIVARFPEVFQGELMRRDFDELVEECETTSRFLGNWHPQVCDVFGVHNPHSHYVELKIAGVRAWYRAAILNGDPRPVRMFSDWDAEHDRLASGGITSNFSDEELKTWADREEERAARAGWRLMGARRAAHRRRSALREQDWERMASVAAKIADLERALKPLRAERQALVASAIGWGRSDSEIAGRAGVSRQAVFQARERLEAEADTAV